MSRRLPSPRRTPALAAALSLALPLFAGSVASLRSDGWEFLAKGKPAYARTAFQNQLKKNPKDARQRTGLGLAELALGNAETACEQLLEAIREAPDDAEARLGLARAFLLRARSRLALGRGDEEETRYFLLDAENQADRAASLKAQDPDAWVVIVEARLARGEFESAEQAIGEAEKRGLDDKRRRRLRGELSYFVVASRAQAAGDAPDSNAASYEEARRTLEALIRDDPAAPEPRFRLGDLEHAFGHWNAALDAWARAVALEPFDRPTLELLLAYLKVPDLRTKARGVLETALDAATARASGGDPRPGYALFCVGQARLADRELEAAAALFKRARALDPSLEVPCSLGLADAAFKSQRYDEAAAAWRAAFGRQHDDAKALVVHLGQAPSVSAGLNFLGDQALKKGAQADARELLKLASELDPENPNLLNGYAFLCRETGQIEPSWEAYSRLIGLWPEQPRYLNDAAVVLHYYLKRELPLARSFYERAVEAADKLIADPTTPQVTRDMATSARTDAANNLTVLSRGSGG